MFTGTPRIFHASAAWKILCLFAIFGKETCHINFKNRKGLVLFSLFSLSMTEVMEGSSSPLPVVGEMEEEKVENNLGPLGEKKKEEIEEEDEFEDEDLGEEGELLGAPDELETPTTSTEEAATIGDYLPSGLRERGLDSVLNLPTAAAVLLVLSATEGISQSFMVPFAIYQIESFGIRLVVFCVCVCACICV